MAVQVGALAKAMAARLIRPRYIFGVTWKPNYDPNVEIMPSGYFVDDATANQIAMYLGNGAKVIGVPPQVMWQFGDPTNLNGSNLSQLANFIQFVDKSIVSAADIASIASQGAGVPGLDIPSCYELFLSYMIPGAIMTPNALQQISNSPIAQQVQQMVPPPAVVIYNPPSA